MATNTLIANKAVRQTEYINTQTVRVPRDTIERRDMGALFMSENKRIPFGQQIVFSNADEVCDYFGANSDEHKIAKNYFGYTEANTTKQTHLSFCRWSRGSKVETITVVPIQLYKNSGGEYDYKRDLVECLLDPMDWFSVSGYDKTPVGFSKWFSDTYGADTDKRGVVCVNTRNDAMPQLYFACETSSDDGSDTVGSWAYVKELEEDDKVTFVLFAEDACRVLQSSGSSTSTKLCTSQVGDGSIFRVDFTYAAVNADGEEEKKTLSTFFEYSRYDNTFVKIDDILPSTDITKTMTKAEMTAAKAARAYCYVDGTCYRKASDVMDGDTVIGKEYSYIVWDKKNLVWADGGKNGMLNSVDFSTDREDTLKELVKADYITLMDSNTILATVDRSTFKTSYVKYDKKAGGVVSACARLSGGILDLTSDILFKSAVTGTPDSEDTDTSGYEDGDIVPFVSTDDFKTRFYKFNGTSFDTTLIEIDGETEFDIVDNYPSATETCYDTKDNFSEYDERTDGNIGLVIDVAGKTLASTYYKWDATAKEWIAVEGMSARDIPSNYPDANYTADGIVKTEDGGYEPVFNEEPTVSTYGTTFATYVDYTSSTFVTYYFVYDSSLSKFVFVRSSDALELYPDAEVTKYSESLLNSTIMSGYEEDEKVVGIVIDKDTFLTQYYLYDLNSKKWLPRGNAHDIVDNYPTSGSLSLFGDQYSIEEINKFVSKDGFTCCVNHEYTDYYGELYLRYFFADNSWTTIYTNGNREDKEGFVGEYDDLLKTTLEERASQFIPYGYPNTHDVVKCSDDGKLYTWREWYVGGIRGLIRDYVALPEIEDKNGDGKYYTETDTYTSITDLADLASSEISLNKKYVNSDNDTTCVFAYATSLVDEFSMRNVSLVREVGYAKDYVCVKKLVGSVITVEPETFVTDYSGITLKFYTDRVVLVPTGDVDSSGETVYKYTDPESGNDDDKFFYTVPISCRDAIDTYEDLASVIQRSVRLQRGMESASVKAVTYKGETHLEIEFEDCVGITSITASESSYAKSLGFADATIEVVEKHPKESPLDAITRVVTTNNNFGSFAFMDKAVYDNTVSGGANVVSYEETLSASELNKLCEWNNIQNFMFLFAQGVRQKTNETTKVEYIDYDSLPQSYNGLGNVIVVRGGEGHDYEEVIPMAVFAATEYESRESIKSFMFKHFDTGTFTPTIGYTPTSFADLTKAEQWSAQNAEKTKMANFNARNLNYVARTQEFGLQRRDYFQTGKCYDGMDISTYCAEVWLKDAFSTALLKLLMQYEKLTPTSSTLNLASAVMMTVITQAEDNGMIVVPDSALDNQTRIYIERQTGVENSYEEIEKDGYLLQFDFTDDTKNGGKAIFYRFMYCKNGDIRKIEGQQAYRE